MESRKVLSSVLLCGIAFNMTGVQGQPVDSPLEVELYDVIHSRDLYSASWVDAEGTARSGIRGSNVWIWSFEEYNPDQHYSAAPCYGTNYVGLETGYQELRNNKIIWGQPSTHEFLTVGAICASGTHDGWFPGVAPGARMVTYHNVAAPNYVKHKAEISERLQTRIFTDSTSLMDWNFLNAYPDLDMVVVWAAGNGGGDGSSSRTANARGDSRVVLVGATDHAGTFITEFSSKGEKGNPATYPLVVAPQCVMLPIPRSQPTDYPYVAYNQIVDWPDCPKVDSELYRGLLVEQEYALAQGTSVSAPIVAAVLALMFEVNPRLNHTEAIYLLTRTADPLLDRSLTPEQHFQEYGWQAGYGLVNASAAVAAAHFLVVNPGAGLEEAVTCHRIVVQDGQVVLNAAPHERCTLAVPEPSSSSPPPLVSTEGSSKEVRSSSTTSFVSALAVLAVAVATKRYHRVRA